VGDSPNVPLPRASFSAPREQGGVPDAELPQRSSVWANPWPRLGPAPTKGAVASDMVGNTDSSRFQGRIPQHRPAQIGSETTRHDRACGAPTGRPTRASLLSAGGIRGSIVKAACKPHRAFPPPSGLQAGRVGRSRVPQTNRPLMCGSVGGRASCRQKTPALKLRWSITPTKRSSTRLMGAAVVYLIGRCPGLSVRRSLLALRPAATALRRTMVILSFFFFLVACPCVTNGRPSFPRSGNDLL